MRPVLLFLLWVWALSVFVAVDMFFNVPAFDAIRPWASLYHGMRRAGHQMVGEPVLDSGARGEFPRDLGLVASADFPAAPGARSAGAATAPRADLTAAAGNGGFTAWNDPGPMAAQSSYVDGRREGVWEWRWPDGAKRERREYKSGLLHGKVESWYAGGQPQVVEEYADGRPQGEWRRWYSGGQPAAEEHYENGTLHGRLTHWHENGQKAAEAVFVAGSSVGPVVRWHTNGRKAEEGMYVGGKKEGPWFAWDEGGERIQHALYIDGRAVGPGPPGARSRR